MSSEQTPALIDVPPPRPPNAWILYRSDMVKALSHVDPLHKIRGNVSKIIGKMWSTELEEVKKDYARKAEILRRAHRDLHPNYKYQPFGKAGKGGLGRAEAKKRMATIKKGRRATPYTLPSYIGAPSHGDSDLSTQASHPSRFASLVPASASSNTSVIAPLPRLVLRLPPGESRSPTVLDDMPAPINAPIFSAYTPPSNDLKSSFGPDNLISTVNTAIHRPASSGSQIHEHAFGIENISAETLKYLREWVSNYSQAPDYPKSQAAPDAGLWGTENLFGDNPKSKDVDYAPSLANLEPEKQFQAPALDYGWHYDIPDYQQQQVSRLPEEQQAMTPLISDHSNFVDTPLPPGNETPSQPEISFDPEAIMAELGILVTSLGNFDFASLLKDVENDPLFSTTVLEDGAYKYDNEKPNEGFIQSGWTSGSQYFD